MRRNRERIDRKANRGLRGRAIDVSVRTGERMTGSHAPGERIQTLDIVRGVAVMGILAMNIVAFAMPGAAYLNPAAYGTEGPADLASWLFSFLLIDGRMRGFFSFLFGASMLLVIERAEASGASPASIHYRRMLWLLLFGLIHYYFIWYGDILSLYAPVGMVAFAFRRCRPKVLIGWAVALLVVQLLLFAGITASFYEAAARAAAPNASAEAIQAWATSKEGIGLYTPAQLDAVLATHRGSYADLLAHMLTGRKAQGPIQAFLFFGWETLAYMLLGMAALKTGFLTGAWPDRSYRRIVWTGFAIGIPAYAILAWQLLDANFSVLSLFTWSITATVPFRVPMILATASLVILLTRRRTGLTDRIAAAGRAAFTNYLGTSLVMTFLFYGWGLGLYGTLPRAELWLLVVAMWAIMLLWSRPWLDRFRYGPFEWLWRSLARWQLQPMRRPLPAPAE